MSSNDDITRALTMAVLSDLSPEEVLLARQYNPDKRARETAKGFLGAGLDLAIPMLLPLVWSFFADFVKAVGRSAADTVAKLVGDRFGKWLMSDTDASTIMDAATQQQLVEKVATAFIERGHPAAEARRLADTVGTCLISHAALLRNLAKR